MPTREYFIERSQLKDLAQKAKRIHAKILKVENLEMDWVKVVVGFQEND